MIFSNGDRAIDVKIVGNAKIAGLTTDLKMHGISISDVLCFAMYLTIRLQGLMYNTAVTLFFVPYALLEVPSNIILKMMRPSVWMSILLFCWGLVMTLVVSLFQYHHG